VPHADTLSQRQRRQRHQRQLGGSRYGLIGRNGVGKSTLLRAMAERDGQGHSGRPVSLISNFSLLRRLCSHLSSFLSHSLQNTGTSSVSHGIPNLRVCQQGPS